MSTTDFDVENSSTAAANSGCFKRRLALKRKHSEMENEKEDLKSHGNKSIFTSLKEILGFKPLSSSSSTTLSGRRGDEKAIKKSILSPLRGGGILNESGEHNFSHGFSSFASTPLGANHSSNIVTNRFNNIEEIPRKRVKFDEENLIVSSITYQRQNATREYHQPQQRQQQQQQNEGSLLSKFINFTANLF